MKQLVQGHGPIDAKLWVIGEAPNEDEVAAGQPFVGASGNFLKEKLQLCGINPAYVRYETMVPERPPQNKFAYFEADPQLKAQVYASVSDLMKRIKAGKANVVFLQGSIPLKYFLDVSDISAWRGHIVWSEKCNCKIIASYHPSFCMRQRYWDKGENPGQAEALYQADVQKVAKESMFPEMNFHPYKTLIAPTYIQARDFLEKLLDEKDITPLLSYDIETVSGCLIDCISFSPSDDFSISIPLYNRSVPVTNYWNSDFERISIFKLIRAVLRSDIPKVAQNSQYDNLILEEYYNIRPSNLCWDTMVAAHNIYSDLPKDLGTLISLYTNLPYQKYLGRSNHASDHWEYNATDALANRHVMAAQIKEMQEFGILEHYKTITHPVIRCLTAMQIIGVNVDLSLRDKALYEETYFQDEILTILDEVFPVKVTKTKKSKGVNFDHKINPKSGPDKAWLFLDKLKQRRQYKDGAICLDKNAFKTYMEGKIPRVKILAEIFYKYSISVMESASISTELRNGRMHTAYDISGTDTGRLNSKKSIFGGRNLQNVKPGVQRQMLIAG